ALFSYDFILTFESEVTLFWEGGHLSGATILFLLNRYITLASQVIGYITASSAFPIEVASNVLGGLQYLPWAAFSEFRTYALCPHPYRWPISASVFALSSVPIVTDMWVRLYGLTVVNDPVLGIAFTNPISASTILKALLVLSTLQMTFTLTGVSVADNAYSLPTSVIAYLEEPLTSILTSRFLIDLQKAQRNLAGSSQSVSLGEVGFQPETSGNISRFIGSLGAQLSFHEIDEENEVEHTP
ncbi:hypothetical protein BD311DRAFT_661177, partial [Dichomitus squalens]